jgi:hypothetical protein
MSNPHELNETRICLSCELPKCTPESIICPLVQIRKAKKLKVEIAPGIVAICRYCKKRPTVPDRTRCQPCADVHAARNRARYQRKRYIYTQGYTGEKMVQRGKPAELVT